MTYRNNFAKWSVKALAPPAPVAAAPAPAPTPEPREFVVMFDFDDTALTNDAAAAALEQAFGPPPAELRFQEIVYMAQKPGV